MDNMYSRGKIYKIVSPSHPDLVYYGSTVNELYKRLNQHKLPSNGTNSKLIMCYDDCKIILVENFSCNSRNELLAKEYEYILANECVNKMGKGFDKKEYRKEYYIENKEYLIERMKEYRTEHKENIKKYRTEHSTEIKEQRKKYYAETKDKIIERMLQKVTCECGTETASSNLLRHKKTLKHMNLMKL